MTGRVGGREEKGGREEGKGREGEWVEENL